MDLHLSGKTALVTGASKGIGLAITKALVDAGAHVVAGSRRLCGPPAPRCHRSRGVAVALSSSSAPSMPTSRTPGSLTTAPPKPPSPISPRRCRTNWRRRIFESTRSAPARC